MREEAAAVTATRDARRPTSITSEDLQLSGEEFASFIENMELSDVVHVPTSLTSCEPVNLMNRSRRNSLGSDEVVQANELGKSSRQNRLMSMPCTGNVGIKRPSFVTTPRSRSHVSDHWCHENFDVAAKVVCIKNSL